MAGAQAGALEMDDASIGGADRPLLPSVNPDLLLASHSAATLSATFLPGASLASKMERSRVNPSNGGADRPLLPSVSPDLLLASHSAATLSAIFLPGELG